MENRKKEFHPVAQISIGAMNYSDSNGTLPANSYAPDGTPLLSWRVHILPYMGEERLYLQFHLDEPWDSPHNRSLLNRMPRIFAGPTQPAARLPTGNRTPYRGFSMPGALMEPPTARKGGGPNGLSQADVTDGPANTLLFVKAATAVEWTKPDDLSWTYGQHAPAFGTDPTDKVFFACFANGEIKPLRKTITPEQLKAAVTYAGGESETLD